MDIKRFIARKINRLLEMFPVVTLIGPRQSGKSTLVRQLHPDWKCYDLESPDDYQLITDDPVSFLQSIVAGRAPRESQPDLLMTSWLLRALS